MTPNELTEDAVADFYAIVPRLIVVAGRAVISFALWHGANRALLSEGGTEDSREIVAGYRADNMHMAVVRLDLLLDRDPKMVSFQRAYRHLQRPEVLDGVVRRSVERAAMLDTVEDAARVSIKRFQSVYRGVFVDGLHGRLAHFRNRGVAHLTTEEIEKRITYPELELLARAVAQMSECLATFVTDCPLLIWEHEIEQWSDRAMTAWMMTLGVPDQATPS